MLVQQIKKDRIQAMKEKDTAKRATLELVLALLEKEKVALKLVAVEDLSQEQTEMIINRYIKALDKEAEAYATAGQSTEKQDAERAVLLGYLPKQMTENEIRHYIAGIDIEGLAMGQFIGAVSKALKGQASGALISKIVKEVWPK